MKDSYRDLGVEQWRFLAVLEALGGTVHINILDNIAPLTAGQLIDLLKKTADSSLLRQDSNDTVFTGTSLPRPVKKDQRV